MKKFFFPSLGLKGKLVITMATLFILSSVALFIISQHAQKSLIREFEDNIDDLTRAIEVSVQKLTSSNEIESSKMKEMLERFKKRGINEISILSEDKEIIASSNPKKIGTSKVKTGKETDFLIKAELGLRTANESIKEFNIPIIIGDENYGYINIIMHLESFTRIQQKNFYMRLFMTLFIFLAGTLVFIFVANKYIHPIQNIVDAIKGVSKEELLPVTMEKGTSPEIKELIYNFNDMINKLHERKALETRIKDMEHMFQVGQLSSAIAHEIKNPLNFMSLAVSQIKDEKDLNDEIKTILCALEEEIRKLGSLVSNFLEYGRPLKLKMEYFNLIEVVNDMIKFIKTKTEHINIKITLLAEEEVNMIGDREKLSGCLLNLFLNAIDSIKLNGHITVTIKKEGDRCKLSFRDTGHGIPENMQGKIFEPYFSSKETGLGLGLSYTKKIILEHGGDIWLNKEYKEGAEFIIYLPLNL